jgi:hypothetical protein
MSVAVSSMSEPPSAVSGPVRGVSVPVEPGVSEGLWAVSVGAVQMALLRSQLVPLCHDCHMLVEWNDIDFALPERCRRREEALAERVRTLG